MPDMTIPLEERVVLVDSHALGMRIKQRRAAHDAAGCMGMRVETPSSWLASLWQLYGDGRRLVTPLERVALLEALLGEDESNESQPGLARFAARLATTALGVPAFDEACARAGANQGRLDQESAGLGLSAGEQQVLAMLRAYSSRLEALGLIEPGGAARILASQADQVFGRPCAVEVLTCRPLPLQLDLLLKQAAQVRVEQPEQPADQGLARLNPQVQLRFAFPAGRYAQAVLVDQLIAERACRGRVLVTAHDPLALFQDLDSALAEQGVSVAVAGGAPFGSSHLGRTVLELRLALQTCGSEEDIAGTALKEALADAARSPYAGLKQSEALSFDAALRADRIKSIGSCLQAAAGLGAGMRALVTAAAGAIDDEVIEQLSNRARELWRGQPAKLGRELGGVTALSEAAHIVKLAHGDGDAALRALNGSSLRVQWATPPLPEPSQVIITSMQEAGSAALEDFDTVVMLDQTSLCYPLSDAGDAAATLLGKLGCAPDEKRLQQARRLFSRVASLPRSLLVVSRPLNDENAEPTYPSAMMSELVDCYRSDPSATDDIDNLYTLPSDLQAGLIERGEELFFANAAGNPQARQAGAYASGNSAPLSLVGPQLVLTPSSIEAYLECPRKWLYTRKIKAQALDEQFSSMEKGSFSHAVLERFVRLTREAGIAKVDRAHHDDAAKLMDQAFCEVRDEQPDGEPLSGRLVETTGLEARSVDELGQELASWVEFEEELLPGMHPAYTEHVIDRDLGLSFGGCVITGRVDRIDVDDQGRMVVIDYKGSLSGKDGYRPLSEEGELVDGKVQALIYAAVAARELSLTPVGALYISYRPQHTLVGAYDASQVAASDLPGIGQAGFGLIGGTANSFEELIRRTEARVADAAERMRAGEVEPNPAYEGACRFCPVSGCERRMS